MKPLRAYASLIFGFTLTLSAFADNKSPQPASKTNGPQPEAQQAEPELPQSIKDLKSTSPFAQVNSALKPKVVSVVKELKTHWLALKQNLVDIEDQRKKMVEVGKKLAAVNDEGIDVFEKGKVLLKMKYVSEPKKVEPGMEVSAEDMKFLNTIFKKYLYSEPFQYRYSVGQALKKLDAGIDELKNIKKINLDPDNENNSELEILAKKEADTKLEIEKMTKQALEIGLDLNKMGDDPVPDIAGPDPTGKKADAAAKKTSSTASAPAGKTAAKTSTKAP